MIAGEGVEICVCIDIELVAACYGEARTLPYKRRAAAGCRRPAAKLLKKCVFNLQKGRMATTAWGPGDKPEDVLSAEVTFCQPVLASGD